MGIKSVDLKANPKFCVAKQLSTKLFKIFKGPVIFYRLEWVGRFWYETSLKYLIPPQAMVILFMP